jgi:uncharacterized protein (DUF427 family)
MRMHAVWPGRLLAESEATILVEGNHYFPPESINAEYFRPCEQHSTCFWKGVAGYYDLEVEGDRNRAAAWLYTDPSQAAERIRGHIAFWKGVKIKIAPQ